MTKAPKKILNKRKKSTKKPSFQPADSVSAALKSAILAKQDTEIKPPKTPRKKRKKKAHSISPLAPSEFPALPPIAGAQLATHAMGMKYKGRDDLCIMTFAPGTTVAGVFTTSKTCSAAVDWCRKALDNGQARAVVINAGNSNAFTGKAGTEAVHDTVASTAELIKSRQSDVFVASTGVIGVPLDTAPIKKGLESCLLVANEDHWKAAAEAIRTTDTFAKGSTIVTRIDGQPITINGIVKGSGMIAPDMATMLAFIVTDASIPAPVLQTILLLETRESFNNITVDSDTSTSDTVLLFATGKGPEHKAIRRAGDPRLSEFREALRNLMCDLARQVVCDGEGATKLITVHVQGAETQSAAHRIAMSIANSPLVKTAVAGEDPNWGRIVMAVGKSGEAADRDKLKITIGDTLVAENGAVHPDYDETPVAAYMKGKEIRFSVDVGVGDEEATVWTCDLTHGYISINADYRS